MESELSQLIYNGGVFIAINLTILFEHRELMSHLCKFVPTRIETKQAVP
jgi:hypothetical protein